MIHTDCIVVGAGISGLVAAKLLAEKGQSVVVLEAANRPGGRIHTIYSEKKNLLVECGAEFIHGALPHTLKLLDEAGIKIQKVKGKFYDAGERDTDDEPDHWPELMDRMSELTEDIPMSEFLHIYFPGEKYSGLRQSAAGFAAGFDLADITDASTRALYREWTHEEGDQFRMEGGYGNLVDYLEKACKEKGCLFTYGCPVKTIDWGEGFVQINGEENLQAKKLILTVPLGILQLDEYDAGFIRFQPEISAQRSAARQIGFGSVIKIILVFKENFWEKKYEQMGFLFSNEEIPTWWTRFPSADPVLTGWMGGPHVQEMHARGKEYILEKALRSLRNIFQLEKEEIDEMMEEYIIADWQEDPWSRGGYSYHTLYSSGAIQLLKGPVENTLYFAGEAVDDGDSPGTVESAIRSAVFCVENF